MTARDSCDGIWESGGGVKITVATVAYCHGLDFCGLQGAFLKSCPCPSESAKPACGLDFCWHSQKS